jgi:choline-sulfatase
MSSKLNRREALKLLGTTAALAACGGGALLGQKARAQTAGAANASGRRPNIIYIFSDQQHAKMLSAAGNPYVKTPNLDRLAARGTRFERAYCSNPVCSPSRFSMFTGHYPSRIGMEHNGDGDRRGPVPESILATSLGRVFRAGGYETAYGGKVHLPMPLESIGFEAITKNERLGLAEAASDFIRRKHDKPYLLVASFINPHDICFQAIDHYLDSPAADPKKYPSRWLEPKVTSETLATLKQENLKPGKRGPVVEQATLAAALQLPAGVSREEFFAKYAPPLPDNYAVPEREPEIITTEIIDKEQVFRGYARRTFTDEQWRLHRWAYARLTERMDAEIGKVLQAVREAGEEENTVIVFSSDHGDMDAAHRLEHKSMFYEESANVPFIIAQKGATPTGQVDKEHLVASGIDLIPTLCDYAGITKPEGLPGRSVRALAEGKKVPWREAVVVETRYGRALVRGKQKYVIYARGKNREQLVDLSKDPGELKTFADDPQYKEAVRTGRRLLREEVWARHDDLGESYLIA